MVELSLLLIPLALISVCMIVATVVLSMLARDVRGTLRQVNAMLPTCSDTIREAHRTFGEAHQLLVRTQAVARRAESVVQKACNVALDVIEPVLVWKGKLDTLFTERFGNGARSGPRRR